ncbi:MULTISPECIES: hypothetical protein [Actinomadura]|uniref:Uncharacterized protein n=1 Tax=Actinomadura geliboluensis TaxID=882440 RepID=A0A5S4GSB3_9ACTN|nr:hypothetical protein [Actinomadura geliboluensis]TMR35848.1 hypothetical protein ETD96_22100 [Actinomadura geliboluensis]
MAHRPLSAWVAAVPLSADGTAERPGFLEVNFGDERADARDLRVFATGWERRAIPAGLGGPVLGLVRQGEAVLELDELARPIPVSAEGAALLSGLEDRWPDAVLPASGEHVLAAENVAVRHLLLSRLADEGDPPPEIFHFLPWELVDELVHDMLGVLDGAEPGPIVELRHWFTPAGPRISAALEQLDEGLREPDDAVARVGATALCSRLLAFDPARMPERTRSALGSLIANWVKHDPFLRHTAARAQLRLSGGNDDSAAVRVDPPAVAADDGPAVRRVPRDAARPPFTLVHTAQSNGQVTVNVEAPLPEQEARRVDAVYGIMFVRVVIDTRDGVTRYLIPLRRRFGRLTGLIELPFPRAGSVGADLDGPPIGIAEARHADREEVRRSVRVQRNALTRDLWRQFAVRLGAEHPLHGIVLGELP